MRVAFPIRQDFGGLYEQPIALAPLDRPGTTIFRSIRSAASFSVGYPAAGLLAGTAKNWGPLGRNIPESRNPESRRHTPYPSHASSLGGTGPAGRHGGCHVSRRDFSVPLHARLQ